MNHIMAKLILNAIATFLAVWLIAGHGAWAQVDDLGAAFKKPDATEEKRLRAVLAEPVPQGVLSTTLRTQIYAKLAAAYQLGDAAAREAVFREAIKFLPDANLKFQLALVVSGNGGYDEANELMRQAVATAENPESRLYYTAISACMLQSQGKDDIARNMLVPLVDQLRPAEKNARNDFSRYMMASAAGMTAECLSGLERKFGRHAAAVAAAEASELHARRALAFITAMRGGPSPQSLHVARNLVANSIETGLMAYRDAGQYHSAENALANYMRFSREVQLPPTALSSIYATAGTLRFSQREFALSEQLHRKGDAIAERLGHQAGLRIFASRGIWLALAGQQRWPEALREVERLDTFLVGADAGLKNSARYPDDRGIVSLGNQRYSEAAALFEEAAHVNRTLYGDAHYLAAQSSGLQGVALWRSGTPEKKVRAIPLLKIAVRNYMSPANADYMENVGLRKELREIIFAAYLEAVSSTPGEDAVQALGAADWVRGGVVQEALGDAAARAAASTPALADVVRKEQDAKNEVAGLRRYLSGEAGGAASPLPVIAAQMRERIAVLEAERAKLQAEIKAKFPDYERLVRPTPPSVQDIARQLEPQQALLMLLPTSDAVYGWAVASDRPATFVRVPLPEAQLKAMVAGLRRELDFANGASVGKAFDSASAFALYDKLLAPLSSAWQGKTQWVVAAGGALSQLPFSILHTKAGGGMDANAPWLIKEASITQVPSLSAWLAIKSLAKASSAPQAFAGWGDPAFGPQTVAANATRSTQARSITLTRASTLTDLDHPERTTTAPSALQYARIPALPDTRDELLAIAGTLNANPDSDLFLGAKATRDSVLAASRSGDLAKKRVIAFATHGLMAGDLPNLTQPALAMAATGTEDKNPFAPLLTLEDVLTLKLNADWVVLSACNTAAADGKAEEALSGLARGFFYAGSRSLLVTHWAVESESAKELTTSTFAHYTANPQAPKAESLRQAMLKVMAMPQYGHPAYWAPYALVGDGGR